MSNPSVCFLAETKINGVNLSIEDNLGESIHIHYGQFRVSMGIREFISFSNLVIASARELFSIHGLNFELFDEESFKIEWLYRYSTIKVPRMNKIALSKLCMKESYVNNREIKRIIPLEESGYTKFLRDENYDSKYYEEKGQFEKSRKEKLFEINNKIMEEGYPFDNKYILIDQDGYILDGNKRASCLFNMFGGDKCVPVLQIDIGWGKDIADRREEAEKKVREYQDRILACDESDRKCNQVKIYELSEIVNEINKKGIPYFVVYRNKTVKTHKIVYADIILDEGTLETLKSKFTFCEEVEHPYMDYEYIYAVKKPMSLKTTEGTIYVSEKICVKSKFKNQLLPLEMEVERWVRKNVCQGENGIRTANDKAQIFITIMDCLLEKEKFTSTDKLNMEKSINVFEDKEFVYYLERELYGYTEEFIQIIKKGNYENAISRYIAFSDY